MTKQEEKIVDAALVVFMRYGIGRTTMSDIAKEAGVVRQTLYTVYANKDEVLCAAIRHFSMQSLAATKVEWETAENLNAKLDIFFDHAILKFYSVVRNSPDASEMFSGYNDAGKAEIRRMNILKIKAISEILMPHAANITAAGLGVKQLADYILYASMGLRDTAVDVAHLKSQLTALKMTVLSLAKA